MAKRFPNYIYKVESEARETVYVDCITKVTGILAEHSRLTGRVVEDSIPLGKWRAFRLVDDLGMSLEYNHSTGGRVCDHTFLVEQIEVK